MFKFAAPLVRSSLYTTSAILTGCSIIFQLASLLARLVVSMSSRGMRLRSRPSLVVSRALSFVLITCRAGIGQFSLYHLSYPDSLIHYFPIGVAPEASCRFDVVAWNEASFSSVTRRVTCSELRINYVSYRYWPDAITFSAYLTEMLGTTCFVLQVKRPSSLPTVRDQADIVE